jgi:hypothetical protein
MNSDPIMIRSIVRAARVPSVRPMVAAVAPLARTCATPVTSIATATIRPAAAAVFAPVMTRAFSAPAAAATPSKQFRVCPQLQFCIISRCCQ